MESERRDRTHIEVVHTEAGWHIRKRADNGEILWTSEKYTRRHNAKRAARKEAKAEQIPLEYVDERGR